MDSVKFTTRSYDFNTDILDTYKLTNLKKQVIAM